MSHSANTGDGFVSVADAGRRSRDGAWLLQHINCHVNLADRIAVVGPSGGGKTLLLRCLALLDPWDVGQLRWCGRPVHGGNVPAYRRRVMYVHQRPTLIEGTVEDNLRLPYRLAVFRKNRFDRQRAIDRLGQLSRPPSFLGARRGDLSGGESQLVSLLRAIQLEPQLLLLDEPTSALDAGTIDRVEQLILAWRDESPSDRAFVWASHDENQTRRVANRYWYVQNGRLAERGR
jgi:putative ABC transport system ATP-binding protein